MHSKGLDFLETRRLHVDLTFCYRSISGEVQLSCENFLQHAIGNCRTSARNSHSKKLIVPFAHKNIRYNFFANRVILPWNALPENVVSAKSSKRFRKLLLNENLCHFLSDFTG